MQAPRIYRWESFLFYKVLYMGVDSSPMDHLEDWGRRPTVLEERVTLAVADHYCYYYSHITI